MAEQIRENIVNIKETQEELKKEVDSLVLEHLKQQQQTPIIRLNCTNFSIWVNWLEWLNTQTSENSEINYNACKMVELPNCQISRNDSTAKNAFLK